MGLRHLLTASGLGCVAAVVAGCGSSSSGLLTGAQASSLKANLDTINADVNAGQCNKARAAVQTFDATVKQLPASVNATLIGNLGRGATRLQSLTENCGAGNVTTPTSTSTSSSTTSSTTPTVATTSTSANTGDTGTTANSGSTGNTGDTGSSTGNTGSSTGNTGNSGNTGDTGSSTGNTGNTGAGNTGGTGSGGAGIGSQNQVGGGQ